MAAGRVVRIEAYGSSTVAGAGDGWSDLDLRVELDGDVGLEVVPAVDAAVWAVEEHRRPDVRTLRLVLVDGRRIDLSVSGGRLTAPAPAEPEVNEVRFLAAAAAAKLGRGDRLIGGHLVLELLRRCLVQGMLLRDRDEGSSVHRFGTARDAVADEVTALAGLPLTVTPRPNVVEHAVALFDSLRTELDPSYLPDGSGLTGVLDRGLSPTP